MHHTCTLPHGYVNIVYSGNDTIDLGKIEMIYNRSIGIDSMPMSDKINAKPMYCWATLLGYTLINEVEERDLLSSKRDSLGNAYQYQYDPKTNTVTIDFQKLKEYHF